MSVRASAGDNVEAQLLLKDFDAIVVCTGATQTRDRLVGRRRLGGVHFAMEYLTANTQALLAGATDASPIHARGKDGVVIGGGDTGTDIDNELRRFPPWSLVSIVPLLTSSHVSQFPLLKLGSPPL